MSSDLTIRPVRPADKFPCAKIIYTAFCGIADRHNFPHDFPSQDAVDQMSDFFIDKPTIHGFVAEQHGRVVGCNFLDERDAIRGVGPITVDPAFQGHGVGRKLMEAVLERGRGSMGIRLVQDAFNTTSLSLYASLGFHLREPLALMNGTPSAIPTPGNEGRLMLPEDLEQCAASCRTVHGFDRTSELRDALQGLRPCVLTRNGNVVAYASCSIFWALNHGVATSEQDLTDLIAATAQINGGSIALLVPLRQAELFKWCLTAGLRVVKPMNLMSIGEYTEPRGPWFPSVSY